MLNFWVTRGGSYKEDKHSPERHCQHFPHDQGPILPVTTAHLNREIEVFGHPFEWPFEILSDEQEELPQALTVRNLPTTVIIGSREHLSKRVMLSREWDRTKTVSCITSLPKQM